MEVGEITQGVDFSTDKFDFQIIRYDWKKGDWRYDYVDELSQALGLGAYPIGFTEWGGRMVVDELGRVYCLGDIDFFAGHHIDEAIERTVCGVKMPKLKYKLSDDDTWVVSLDEL